MRKNAIAVLVLTASLFSTTVVAQAQEERKTINLSAMSNEEIKALSDEQPYMVGVVAASKGQDIDLTTISTRTTIHRPGQPDSVITKVLWEIRRYTGFRFTTGLGVSYNHIADSTGRFGGALSFGVGYVQRRWGVDTEIGFTGAGDKSILGEYNFSIMPYGTPLRSSDDLFRVDIGAILGVQQAPANTGTSFRKGDIVWGDGGRTTTVPRAMAGGFIRLGYRKFKTGLEGALEAGAVVFNGKVSFDNYVKDVANNEVLLDQFTEVKDLHVLVGVKLKVNFVPGKRHDNYSENKNQDNANKDKKDKKSKKSK